MATKFYLNNNVAPYTPATIRGAWDVSASAVARQLAIDKILGGVITSIATAEAVATADWDVLLFRGVSGPVAAQTISGTLNVMLSVIEANADADFVYHIHAYVTVGDSDTVRGTLITDYAETTANEWGTVATTSGRALAAAQTVTNVICTSGDRIVIEIGYRAKNTHTTSRAGTLRYGGNTTVSDLTAAGNGTTLAGFITFNTDVTMETVPAQISQVLVEGAVANTTVAEAQISQVLMEGAVANISVAEAQISQMLLEVAVANFTAAAGFPYSQVVTVG